MTFSVTCVFSGFKKGHLECSANTQGQEMVWKGRELERPSDYSVNKHKVVVTQNMKDYIKSFSLRTHKRTHTRYKCKVMRRITQSI